MSELEPRRLDAERARFRSDVRGLGIASSADVPALDALGDERGRRALELALNMPSPGYHAFVCGAEGPVRLERIARVARACVQRETSLWDWVYVHRFSVPDRPRAMRLSAGDGQRLKRALAAFVRDLREDLPKAFREEAFDREKARVIDTFESRQREQQKALGELAERSGFAMAILPGGTVALIPVIDGKRIESEAQWDALPAERRHQLEEARQELEQKLREHFERHRDERHRVDQAIRRIEREFAARIVEPRARALALPYGNPELEQYLAELVEYLLDHLEPFRGEPQAGGLAFALLPETQEPFAVYDVNVVVDNSKTRTAPIIVVDSPTYKNLFGTIDRTVDPLGRLRTDFRRIHPGALLEGDGGVVLLNAEDALVEPFVWRNLRRALRARRVEIEAYDPFVGYTAAGIRPDPIEMHTKVVLLGPRWLFEVLLRVDEEFPDLFKVFADFSPVVERDDDSTRALCGRIAALAAEENLPVFEASGLDALVELAVREAGERCRLHLGSESVLDVAREAAARARAAGCSEVAREDVQEVIRDRVHRLDRVEQLLRDEVSRGVLLIDVEGREVGQVNALSVAELGGYAFGRPCRLTATVGLGAQGVVSIDRETHLSGAIHDKGVMILEGFLRNQFAHGRPLSLVTSVVFEQSYAQVEGDSAALAELLAILSRLGGFGLRQDRAVTGSVNQLGEVQAVGGVNEKVEGFFDCCRVSGLSGEQGVVFPAANCEHLALRDDVVEALQAGSFHLFPAHNVEEALIALTGAEPGTPTKRDTLYYAIDQALEDTAQRALKYRAPAGVASKSSFTERGDR